MNPDELLLRDIHLPEPVSWWPPAPGWWLLVGGGCCLLAVGVWWWRRRIAIRNAPATIARIELDRLRMTWTQHGDEQQLVNEVSTWLRRAGMSLSSRQQAASLTGDPWRQHLDDMAGEPIFDEANGRLITQAPYRVFSSDRDPVDGEHLLALCERWLGATSQRVRQK